MPRKKKAKTSKSISVTESHKAKYELVGRKIVCLLHPFGSPRAAINVRLKVESARESELDVYNSSDITRQHQIYDMILTYALGLAEELNNRMEADKLQKICAWIMKGMSDQCSTDLRSVKHAGLAYLFADGKLLEPPIAKSEDKSMHGFNHPQITRMLCPRKKLDVFDEDPDIIVRALQEGMIRTTATNWPTCFYEEGVYDPNNRAKGLFCSHAIFRFYMHLFIGPSAASTNTVTSNASKISKNCAWGLTEVTPNIIAYIHVALYFTLSTAPHWCTTIRQMDLAEMAWLIIEMFNDKDDWTRETLACRAFPKGHGTCEDTDFNDDMAKIRAQRARLSKKAVHPRPSFFGTPSPSPKAPSILLPKDPQRMPSVAPDSEDSVSRAALQPSSITTPMLNTFSTTDAIESDLSPCTSDNEAEFARVAYKTTNTTVSSTSATTSLPAPAALSSQFINPIEPKKKGHAVTTKKTCHQDGKKSNGF